MIQERWKSLNEILNTVKGSLKSEKNHHKIHYGNWYSILSDTWSQVIMTSKDNWKKRSYLQKMIKIVNFSCSYFTRVRHRQSNVLVPKLYLLGKYDMPLIQWSNSEGVEKGSFWQSFLLFVFFFLKFEFLLSILRVWNILWIFSEIFLYFCRRVCQNVRQFCFYFSSFISFNRFPQKLFLFCIYVRRFGSK